MQAKPHDDPSQVADAFAGAVQGEHDAPQVATLALLTQVPSHAWEPALQVNPQAVPSQVAVAPAGAVQGEHDAPQVATLALLTQAPPQR